VHEQHLTPGLAIDRFKFLIRPFKIGSMVVKQAIRPQTPSNLLKSFSEPTMNDAQLSQEIRDANLTYLMLAQNVIRKDKAEALFRLGISEESADLIATLSPAQILKISSSPMLLCRFRVDDDMVWGLLTNHTPSKVDNDATTKLHASILMAGRFAEAL
jgi:flagellar transcriptional activator FlhD